MTVLVIIIVIIHMYCKAAKTFFGPLVVAMETRAIDAIERHTHVKRDMAKAIVRLIEFGLIVFAVLLAATW